MRNSSRKVKAQGSQNSKQKKRAQLKKSFKTVKTSVGMIKLLKEMETCFEESELGLECWTIARVLLIEDQSPEKVLSFAKRALKTLIDKQDFYSYFPCIGTIPPTVEIDTGSTNSLNHGSGLFIACVCNLLASASLALNRYGESLSYLNWAVRNLTKLEKDSTRCAGDCVLRTLESSQYELFNVKAAMGRREEAAVHLRNVVEIKEKSLEDHGSLEIGEAYKSAYLAYVAVMNYKEAMPLCVKALEIYTKHKGSDCREVAQMRRHLGVMYNGLGEYEKAIEQNQLAQVVLKKATPDSPKLLEMDIENGNMLIDLDRYEEAIQVMKSVVSHSDAEGSVRAISFVTMAKAFCRLKKFSDAKKHMRTAQRMLERKGVNPIYRAFGFAEVSRVYGAMNDYETAISLIRKVLAMPDLNKNLLAQSSSRLFSLITLSGKVEEGIPYMEDVVEKLKERFCPKHCEVGYAYFNLGIACWKSSQQESAVKFLVNAKDILDASLGPYHLDLLTTSHTLSINYAEVGRFHTAIELEEKVVESIKGLEPSLPNFLVDAINLLNKMKESVSLSGCPARTPLQSKDDEDLCATISKFDISEDGMGT